MRPGSQNLQNDHVLTLGCPSMTHTDLCSILVEYNKYCERIVTLYIVASLQPHYGLIMASL